MKFSELKRYMSEFNDNYNIKRKVDEKHNTNGDLIECVGEIVISNKVLKREYSILERTYSFNNYNKALTSDDLGYSIFAFCDYDNDVMRIENYDDDAIEDAYIIKEVR